jgi:uncharacterized cofD-like protein
MNNRDRRQTSLPSYKWLRPGIGVKRWLALMGLGSVLLGLAAVYTLIILNSTGLLPERLYRGLTLQFVSPTVRVALSSALGIAAMVLAFRQLSRAVFLPFLRTGGVPLADAVYHQRRRMRGPHIVAIGGGTGLSALLRGLKSKTGNITAIITVADDGGSSGRLRRELGLPPPGDFRNCIAALADDEALITQLFQYRFGLSAGIEGRDKGELAGHSFGNLFIAAMTGITGSFESGVAQAGRVLAIQGRILPSSLADVTLVANVRRPEARADQGSDPESVVGGGILERVSGESQIPESRGVIERVFLHPEHAPAYPAAVKAILTADLVVLGPGSLFTSVLPNLLIGGLRQALAATPAPVIYVCNVATQPGETDGFDSADHVRALERHIGRGFIDLVIVNSGRAEPEAIGRTEFVQHSHVEGIPVVVEDLVDPARPWRHDSDKLSNLIMSILGKMKEQAR